MLTTHKVSLDTKEGKGFLRKVIRDGDWNLRAAPDTEWAVTFERTIKGNLGEPDEEVIVSTDETVGMPGEGAFGERRSFEDCHPVTVARPRYVHLNGETPHAAKLLLDGYRLEVIASSGSANSSRLGLSFYYLNAKNPKMGCYGLEIGGQTVAENGRTICQGVVSLP